MDMEVILTIIGANIATIALLVVIIGIIFGLLSTFLYKLIDAKFSPITNDISTLTDKIIGLDKRTIVTERMIKLIDAKFSPITNDINTLTDKIIEIDKKTIVTERMINKILDKIIENKSV